MKGLSISGASTKIAFSAGAAIYLLKEKGYKPNFITGVSAGGILAVPLALALYDEIERQVKNFTLKDIFDISPTNKFCSAWRILTGKESIGRQENLKKTISKIVSEEMFYDYKRNPDTARCFLGSVEYKTGKREYFDIKNLYDYNDFLEVVIASSSIPVFVESRKINGGYWYDGGVRDHIGSHWLMERNDMNQHVSIYSRPENFDMTDANWKPKNIYRVLERTIDIMNAEISKNDEILEDTLASRFNIDNKKIFTPYSLTNETYEANKDLNIKWFDLGVERAKKIYDN